LLNQVKPKFATADIQVVDIDGIIKTLQDKNDKWLEQVVFFPSPEAREYIRTISTKKPGGTAKPAATQTPKKK
jgi:hypothetical protein